MITSFWKKIGIQFCDRVGIRINLENATTTGVIIWRTVNDATDSHGTFTSIVWVNQVRSNESHGCVDGIEFRYSTTTEAIKGAVRCGQSLDICITSFLLLANESRYRIAHSHDTVV